MKIYDIAKIINNKIEGMTLNNSNYVSTENMSGNCGGVVDSSSVPTTKVTQFTQGDILLSNIRPYFKKVWFSVFDGGCSNDVICIRTTSDSCLTKYLYYALCTDKFIDTFSASSKGTKMPRGDKDHIIRYPLAIPPSNLLASYEEFASPLFIRMARLSAENVELASLRDWLLPMLMNGQLVVE